MTDLWSNATRDVEGEEKLRAFTSAKLSTTGVWPFLAAATTEADLGNRLALIEDRLVAAVSDPALRREVVASLVEDWHSVNEQRVRTRVAAENQRRAAGKLPDALKDHQFGKDDKDDEKKESSKTAKFDCDCPACGNKFEAPGNKAGQGPTTCPKCGSEVNMRWVEESSKEAGKRVCMTCHNKMPAKATCAACGGLGYIVVNDSKPQLASQKQPKAAAKEPPPFSDEGQGGGDNDRTARFIATVKTALIERVLPEMMRTAAPYDKGRRAGQDDAKAGRPKQDVPERDESGDPSFYAGYQNGYNFWMRDNAPDEDYAKFRESEGRPWDPTTGSVKTAEFPWQKEKAEGEAPADAPKDGEPKAPEGDDKAAPAGDGGDLAAATAGQALTLTYKLADGTTGDTPATVTVNDGTTITLTYDRGTFKITNQGGTWKDSLGTEFTMSAGAPAADPAAAPTPTPLAQTPPKAAAKTAGWVADLDKGIFEGGIDNVTKGMLQSVLKGLSPENSAKFAELPLDQAVTLGWRLVSSGVPRSPQSFAVLLAEAAHATTAGDGDDAFQKAVRQGLMTGQSYTKPGALLPSLVYVVMKPGPNGAVSTDRKTTDRDEANRWAQELLAQYPGGFPVSALRTQANPYAQGGNPYAVDQPDPTPSPMPEGQSGQPTTTKPRQMPPGASPAAPPDPMGGGAGPMPGMDQVQPGDPRQTATVSAVLDTTMPVRCEACGRRTTVKVATLMAGIACACGSTDYDVDDEADIESTAAGGGGANTEDESRGELSSLTDPQLRKLYRDRMDQAQNPGASGPYPDFSKLMQEMRRRGITASLESEPDFVQRVTAGVAAVVVKTADWEGLNTGGASLFDGIRQMVHQLLMGDERIPGWFPESYLTEEEKRSRRWSTTIGGGRGDPAFAFGSKEAAYEPVSMTERDDEAWIERWGDRPATYVVRCKQHGDQAGRTQYGQWRMTIFQDGDFPTSASTRATQYAREHNAIQHPKPKEMYPGQERLFARKTGDWSQNSISPAVDVMAVQQDFRCSTCLHEFVVKAYDPAQPPPSCPNCGSDTTTAAGATGVSPMAAKIAQITAGILSTNPGMERKTAVRLAAATVRRYPKVASA